jgi:uncharacterized protein (TIGR03435 family)
MRQGWWLLVLAAAIALGQDVQPRFEVASIKPHFGGPGPIRFVLNLPQRLTAENVWVKLLIRTAWDVRDFKIIGAPSWVTSDRFDIEAVSEGKTSPAEKRLMLRSLLEERFQLKVHREERQMPVYELTAAKGSLKLHASAGGGCLPPDRNVALAPGQQPRQIEGSAIRMNAFAVWLSEVLQRPVVDRTGFTGIFDVNLTWSDDQVNPTDIDSGSPSIFTALQEQLGLKLASAKGPVQALIIDHAELPGQN